MNGVTGRMGTHQHLVRSILAIRKQGGVKTDTGDIIMPDPILVGRNEEKLKSLASECGIKRFSKNMDTCLSDPDNQIYFDAQTTTYRVEGVKKAIKAKKAIYCEKPIAVDYQDAIALCKNVKANGLKNGIVQDKLWLPGIQKLQHLITQNFFGKVLSVHGEFGYWVFDGKTQPTQRPSWNYRKEDGGGIITDMFSHWRYLVDNLFGEITSVSCLGAKHIQSRIDEEGKEYICTTDDAAYATFLCSTGVICQFNSSWATRVRRDDLLTLQIDGIDGSAVAGLNKCYIQKHRDTPRVVWNPDVEFPVNYYNDWQEIQRSQHYENAFKIQWELFLKHVVCDTPFRWSFLEGAKGLQLADLALQSWDRRCWIDVPNLLIE